MVSWPTHDRRGLASIFDALMFMAAMVSLLTIFSADLSKNEEEPTAERQALVDKAHLVTLRITSRVPVTDGGERDEPYIGLTSVIRPTDGSMSLSLPSWARTEAEEAISCLLGEGWGFEWSCLMSGSWSVLANRGAWPGDRDLYVSCVGEASGPQGTGCIFLLKAWTI